MYFDAESHPKSSKVPMWLQQAGQAPDLQERNRLPSESPLLELSIVRALKNSEHYVSIFSKSGGTASREITEHYWTSMFLFIQQRWFNKYAFLVSSRLLGSSSLFIIFSQSNWKSVYIQVNILPNGHLQTFRTFIIMLPFTGWTYKADLLDRWWPVSSH